MNGLYMMAAIGVSLLAGMVCGVKLEESAWKRAAAKRKKTSGSVKSGFETKPRQKHWTASKLIAFGVLLIDASSTYFVLYLCRLSIILQFTGSLPYLTALIGAMQAATGYVLGHYFKKSTAENTAGGITYDAALNQSTFDTV